MAYDQNNIFAKILRGELPFKKVHENKHALAFHDVNPQMPVHVLVIPKGPYTDMGEFNASATLQEMGGLMRCMAEAAKNMGLAESGYRLISNNGSDAHQEVAHLHFHIFGGRPIMGRMIKAQN